MPGRHLGDRTASQRFSDAATWGFSALVMLALLVVAPLAAGSEWRTVQTGSMEPLISPGDVVLVSPLRSHPEIGDIVAFPDPLKGDRDILHRVVGFAEDGSILTKGDANDTNDPWQLDPSLVLGESTLTIPRIGFLVEPVGTDLGILVFLVLPAMAIIFNESRVWYRFIRHGSDAFEPSARGRHRPRRGRHMTVPA
ncbi:MAG: signal peptidase I [Acidimicrobiia bacterium]|jgi:signal peptidase I